jgi:spore coat protein U-like protein
MSLIKAAATRTAAVIAGYAIAANASWAVSSSTVNFTVSANVIQKCRISATNLLFGSYDPVEANLAVALNASGPGTLVVTCTKNASAVTLALNFGNNSAGGTNRRMLDTSGAGMFLTYQLYQPPTPAPGAACTYPGATIWGDGTNGTVFTPRGSTWGNTAPQVFNVCGTIPAGQNIEPGRALDLVTATINF